MKKINGGSTCEEDEEKKTHKGKNQCKEEKKKCLFILIIEKVLTLVYKIHNIQATLNTNV